MSAEKRQKLIDEGRLKIADDGSETRIPDPAVYEAELAEAVKAGRVKPDGTAPDDQVPPGGPVDAEAKPMPMGQPPESN